ncbi:Phosphoglycerate mutase OS=Rhizobacter sp. Root404 OX=1736528 GN=ASC76_21690 PE=4 SV=1 [Rhizobacter fulvus]|jgi:phosphohistidine phosphatase SixA
MRAMQRRDLLRLAAAPLVGPALVRTTIAAPADALVERLRAGGVILLLRHATTDPGVGDPPGFRLDDCSTQRNLSDPGRQLAQRIGAWARTHGLVPARVRSSAWCRCVDTARLAFGKVEPWPALNSFFGDDAARQRQTAALATAAATIPAGRFEVWVTHQVNITALTGQFADMGAGCVIEGRPDAPVRVLGAFAVS